MFIAGEEGQGLVEYALILVLVAVIVVAGITAFGQGVQGLYEIVSVLDVW
jgi:pilus assembly protein Flp/PilA